MNETCGVIRKFCVNERGSSVSRRVMLPERKTHGHGYHADLELSDRSQG